MANTIPLNKFVLIAQELNAGASLIYSSSLDVASIILSTQVTNITATNQYVSLKIQKSGSISYITLLKDGVVPPNESLNPLSGKLVLEKHDSLYMDTPNAGSLHIVLSVLENAIN